MDQGGIKVPGGFAGLASRCESPLVHIFLPLWCWQFRKGDSDVKKEVLLTPLVSLPPCPVLPMPLSTWLLGVKRAPLQYPPTLLLQ